MRWDLCKFVEIKPPENNTERGFSEMSILEIHRRIFLMSPTNFLLLQPFKARAIAEILLITHYLNCFMVKAS